MPTSIEYETLLSGNIAPGEVVRIKCESHREYNSQRMTFYRALKKLRSQGIDVSRIQSRKLDSETGEIILEIENKLPGSTVFLSKKHGETDFREVSLEEKETETEEEQFEKWKNSIKE